MLWLLKVICKCPVPGFLASHHSSLLQDVYAKAIAIPWACRAGITLTEIMEALHQGHF